MLNGHILTTLVYDNVNVENESNIGSANGATLNTINFDALTWTATRITTTLGLGSHEVVGSPVTIAWNPTLIGVFVQNELVAQNEALIMNVNGFGISGSVSDSNITTIQSNITYLKSIFNTYNVKGESTEGTSYAGGTNPQTPSV
jgi:hypothetical protein